MTTHECPNCGRPLVDPPPEPTCACSWSGPIEMTVVSERLPEDQGCQAGDIDHPLHGCRIEAVQYVVTTNPHGIRLRYSDIADARAVALDYSIKSWNSQISLPECRNLSPTVDTVIICRGPRGLVPEVIVATEQVTAPVSAVTGP